MKVQQGKLSLRKNDQVEVIAGREKGKTGKILKVDSKNCKVTVEKVNLVKRHTRPTQTNSGGILEKELPVHYSNVLLLCPKCNRGVRHSQKLDAKSGKKMRVCKRCNGSLEIA